MFKRNIYQLIVQAQYRTQAPGAIFVFHDEILNIVHLTLHHFATSSKLIIKYETRDLYEYTILGNISLWDSDMIRDPFH